MPKSNRRAFLKKAPAVAAAAVVAAPATARAQGTADKPTKKVFYRSGKPPDNPPLFNGTVLYGNLVFISGIGYHEPGDITLHTTKVLEQMKAQLEAAGSSMEKVLKVNVYLNDLKDYDAMNAVFRGKFGPGTGRAHDHRGSRWHPWEFAGGDRLHRVYLI